MLPLLGLVAIVVAGALVFLLHDGGPKLAEGSFASQGDGRWHVPEPVTMEGNRPERQLDLIYEQGQDATFTLSVRNDGKHADRVHRRERPGRERDVREAQRPLRAVARRSSRGRRRRSSTPGGSRAVAAMGGAARCSPTG